MQSLITQFATCQSVYPDNEGENVCCIAPRRRLHKMTSYQYGQCQSQLLQKSTQIKSDQSHLNGPTSYTKEEFAKAESSARKAFQKAKLLRGMKILSIKLGRIVLLLNSLVPCGLWKYFHLNLFGLH